MKVMKTYGVTLEVVVAHHVWRDRGPSFYFRSCEEEEEEELQPRPASSAVRSEVTPSQMHLLGVTWNSITNNPTKCAQFRPTTKLSNHPFGVRGVGLLGIIHWKKTMRKRTAVVSPIAVLLTTLICKH